MSLFGRKKIQAFGLDISDTSIKVAQLNLHKGKLYSGVFADVPLVAKTITNHMIVSEERLAASIMNALKTAKKIDTKYVVCSVPEAKSFVRIVQIPLTNLSDKEIEGALPYELEQDIPIPIDQVYLDWQILRQLPGKLELLVTASSKDYVDILVTTLKSIKLKPVVFEIGSQATARALVNSSLAKESVLIVDIGAQQTSFIIVDQGTPLYTSSVPVAGNSLTEAIARNLGIPWGQAEKSKVTHGLISQMQGEEAIREAILPVLDNIIDETKNVIRYFEEHSELRRTISTVVLCGGSSRVPGAIEYFSTRINLGSGRQFQILQGNPWVNMVVNQGQIASMNEGQSLGYSTAIGLALRGVDYEAD